MFNLRTDPYERANLTSNIYYDWLMDHVFLLVPAQVYVGKVLMTFKEFPPSQRPPSFSSDQVMQKLQEGGGSHSSSRFGCEIGGLLPGAAHRFLFKEKGNT